ncbi:hypothetical protein PF005_g7676 [Phytophthora fragariae]|uniref:Uncharacterized protein n=1 Tax=Phytophthora fragariae TaxID=53985 RepID=A0A6A3F7R1_9STRA|nr:hypothetical protein PF009_g8344 [Phytophthora fragariae]KAE9102384.1 hypothetical protein PF010_g14121 [Phytophthora fragariae]KAE9123835.1 hypothetical protein PF007_g6924 [Phytophthora fragariae]KAE9218500.1 hypothetical protein PF004_g13844 [Phytophthora fragariae]KAE9219952.1 hypothetical protein PF005_g7676 [Phytophthora fragariae]
MRFLRGFLKLPHVQAALATHRKNTSQHALETASGSDDSCEPNTLAEASVQEMISVQVDPATAGYTPGRSINADDPCEMIGYADGKDNVTGAVKWPSEERYGTEIYQRVLNVAVYIDESPRERLHRAAACRKHYAVREPQL